MEREAGAAHVLAVVVTGNERVRGTALAPVSREVVMEDCAVAVAETVTFVEGISNE